MCRPIMPRATISPAMRLGLLLTSPAMRTTRTWRAQMTAPPGRHTGGEGEIASLWNRERNPVL